MGRRPDSPAVQHAKGNPGKRLTKADRQRQESERIASLMAAAPSNGDPLAPPAFQARAKWRADSADGLPPPKNTERNATPAAPGARLAASSSRPASQRSTPAPEKRSLEK